MSLTEKYNKGLFANWVPKIVQLLLILFFIILLFPMSSIYVGNLSYMVGETGQMAEYFMWANFAGTVGMGAAMPVAFRVKLAFKIRDKVIFILLLVALFNFIIATTGNPIIIVLISILMNFFKMLALIEFMLPVMMILIESRRQPGEILCNVLSFYFGNFPGWRLFSNQGGRLSRLGIYLFSKWTDLPCTRLSGSYIYAQKAF